MDRVRFPIFDDYAKRTLAIHSRRPQEELANAYATFCEAHRVLASEVGAPADARRLDRYLWIAGQHAGYVRRKAKQKELVGLNTELVRSFDEGRWPPAAYTM
jgi:hypothetical protein